MDATNEVMMKQVVIAGITAKVIEFLKRNPRFSFLSQHTAGWNRALSMGISIATSAGYTYAWTGSLEAGGVLTINVPPLEQVLTVFGEFFWHGAFQFLTQEAVYQGLVRPPKASTIKATGTAVDANTQEPIADIQIQGGSAETGSDAAKSMGSDGKEKDNG